MGDLIEFCSRHGVPLQIDNTDALNIVEDVAAREILCKIQPILDVEIKRIEIIHYLKNLIKVSLGVEVFPYGSVPLRTYIPDGDIDLTVITLPDTENALFYDVYALLRKQKEHNKASDHHYKVKDVQQIHAEVKVVKCIIQNFVVDISFNQLGGVKKLCFLEMVDRRIGKDHLFKRSVILLKCWCYYESRILDASHSLLSTYALEILALHILQLFHYSLDGPVAVLHKFLDYYSTFDWENYCITLSGPVSISSLPSQFPLKQLNVIDPLKEENNLGRSVSRGSFFRIRSAFRYGAQKLGEILVLPGDKVENELKKFFSNTLSRHEVISADEHSSAVIHGARGKEKILSSENEICSECCLRPICFNSEYDPAIKRVFVSAPPSNTGAAAKKHVTERDFANKVIHQDRPCKLPSSYPHKNISDVNGQVGSVCLSTSSSSAFVAISQEKKRQQGKVVQLPAMNCCQSGSSRRDKNQLTLTKGPSQCQTSNSGLAASPKVSRPIDKSGIAESNGHSLRNRNINSKVKNSLPESAREGSCMLGV